MIKAEVIAHDGYEVPNWLTKCHDVLTSAPALGTVALLVLAVIGVFVWHGRQPSFSSETGVQSQPASAGQLQVLSADASISAQPTAAAVSASQTSVGPAPASSLGSLQSAGSTQRPGIVNQGLSQALQSANSAAQSVLSNLNR